MAQIDGGLIAETKVRLVKKGSAGGKIDAKFVVADGNRANEDERFWTMSYPPEAQFQRLLAVAFEEPDTIDWTEVLDPKSDFASAQVGETIAWECDVDVAQPSRIAAKGGGGDQILMLMALLAAAGASGLKVGDLTIEPEKAAQVRSQVEIVRELLDNMNVNRVAVGRDADTEWAVFGPLFPDHLRVEDISDERLIVVGKIKRIVGPGETHRLVNTEAMQIMQNIAARTGKTPTNADDNEIVGPALELDILAIYR